MSSAISVVMFIPNIQVICGSLLTLSKKHYFSVYRSETVTKSLLYPYFSAIAITELLK